MSKQTTIEKAIASLEEEIKIRQMAIERLKATAVKAKPKKPRLVAGGEAS